MKDGKQKKWFILAGAVLLLFTVYILLDTFVLTKDYSTDATRINDGMFSDAGSTPGAGRDDESSLSAEGRHIAGYNDENTVISLTQYRRWNTDIYVADVQLTSARYLMTAFAKNRAGRNITEKTSDIAAEHGAILAVNGDFYGAQEKGYVIRNGVIHRETRKGIDVLGVFPDGTLQVISDSDCTASQLADMGVWQVFSFGPALVNGGDVTVGERDEVDLASASNPRTAIGMLEANHYVFVVSDGRVPESEGLSLYQLAHFMKDELHVSVAYNLDGGGSSTLYFCGRVINRTVDDGDGNERSVSDIVYIP